MSYIITDGEGIVYHVFGKPHILEEDEVLETLGELAADEGMSVRDWLSTVYIYDITQALRVDVSYRWTDPNYKP